MILKRLNLAIVVLLALSATCSEQINTGRESDLDGFIVDDDNKDEDVKKRFFLSRGSMALGFMPKRRSTYNGLATPVLSRHIEPSIDLEKSLQTLNVIGDKRGVLPKSPSDEERKINKNTNSNNDKLKNHTLIKDTMDSLKESILGQLKTGVKVNSSAPEKKSSTRNVITNSTVIGYLSNDRKFSIGDVGKQDEFEERNKKKEDEEVKDSENKFLKTLTTKNTSRETVILDNKKNNTMNTATDNNTKSQVDSSNTSSPIHAASQLPGIAISKLHLVNIEEFLQKPIEPLLVDYPNIQENAVKKGEIDSHHEDSHHEDGHHEDGHHEDGHHEDGHHEDGHHEEGHHEDGHHEDSHHEYGHHEDECNDKKECPKNKYCRHFHCYEGHRKHHECHEDDQCIDGMFCVYGRCDDKPKGSPGTICDKDGDCGGGCCVIEPTITEHHGICKSKLEEFHQCSPVLFRKIWLGDRPECGPCVGGLECKERGVISSHLVCIKI